MSGASRMANEAGRLLVMLRGGEPPPELTHEERVAREQRYRDEEERERLDRERRARDEAELAVRRRETAHRSVLPPRVADTILGQSFERGPAIAAVDKWSAGDKQVLVLRGGVGSGKTTAAGHAVSLVLSGMSDYDTRHSTTRKHGPDISWHRPNDFVSAMLHSYDSEAPKLGRKLIVIDDIGRETKQDFCEAVCAFLDDSLVRLVMTTNLSRDEFRARYDERLLDRLNDVGVALTIKGESKRKKTGAF
jgi:DNA replication protein DnaC